VVSWRVGRKVPINVYDENGFPVCQCQTADLARRIVAAIDSLETLDAILNSATDGRECPEWLHERLARYALLTTGGAE
jgi:hypothetical protein